jgi:Tfp pilus assembly protein PilN
VEVDGAVVIKQFTINLNKGEGEAAVRTRRRERQAMILLAGIAVVFLVLTGFTWAQHRQLRAVVTSKQDKIAHIRHQLDSLRREGTNVSKEDVMALAKLENDRFLWARRLEALAQVMPEGMAITGVKFEHGHLIIKAISQIKADEKEFDRVSRLMDILKTTPDFVDRFQEIRFTQSKRRYIEDQEVLDLVVTCSLQERGAKSTRPLRSVERPIQG